MPIFSFRPVYPAFLLLAAAAFAADDVTPAGIMDKYVEVTGGKAAYDKIKSETATGTVEISGMGLSGTLRSYRAAPNKAYTLVEFGSGAGKFEEGVNGDVAWAMDGMQGARIKQGDERAAARRNAALHMETHWRDYYKNAELAGTEDLDGKPCYKLLLTPNEGSAETRYFEKSSGLLIKVVMPVATPDGSANAEIGLSDYRDESGILTPHSIAQKLPSVEILVKIENVKHNPEIAADRFDLPAEIKALAEKK